MATIAEFAGKQSPVRDGGRVQQSQILDSLLRLSAWLEANDYRAYDTFDGLSARYVRPLTFETRLLRTVLQQGVRRFPLNLRPLLGVPRAHSSKGMGFLARGFIRLYKATKERVWEERAEAALQWLIDHQAAGYSGACWGNHFDYQSRTFYLPKGTPTIVWTSLIGHAFLDAFEHFHKEQYLQIAVSACNHIVHDLNTQPDGDGACISYIPLQNVQVHNANTLGGSLLARTYSHTGTRSFATSRSKQCNTPRSTNDRMLHGITGKMQTCTGLITSIRHTFWTASSTMMRVPATALSTAA